MAQVTNSTVYEIQFRVVGGGLEVVGKTGEQIGKLRQGLAEATSVSDAFNKKIVTSGDALRTLAQDFAKGTIGMKTAESALDHFGDVAFRFNNIISQVEPVMQFFSARMKQAFEAGIVWEKGLGNIGTVIETNQKSIAGMISSVEDLQAATMVYAAAIRPVIVGSPLPTEDLLRASYDVLSAGFTKAADAAKIFEAANKLAVVTLGTSVQAVNTLTSVLNAYGMSGERATEVAGAFVVATQVGKMTLNELNQSIGKVIPIAAQLAVPLEEVAAAIAVMTQSGVPAAEAETNLRMAMVSMLKPTKDMQALMEGLNYSNGAAMLGAEGLRGSLVALANATQGDEGKFAKAFSRVQGLNAAMLLGSLNADKYASVTQKVTDEMIRSGLQASELERRYAVQMDTVSSLWEVTKKYFEELKREQFDQFKESLIGLMKLSISFMESWRKFGESDNPIDRLIKSMASWGMIMGAVLAGLVVYGVSLMGKLYLGYIALTEMTKTSHGFLNNMLGGAKAAEAVAGAVGGVVTAEGMAAKFEGDRFSLQGRLNALLEKENALITAKAAALKKIYADRELANAAFAKSSGDPLLASRAASHRMTYDEADPTNRLKYRFETKPGTSPTGVLTADMQVQRALAELAAVKKSFLASEASSVADISARTAPPKGKSVGPVGAAKRLLTLGPDQTILEQYSDDSDRAINDWLMRKIEAVKAQVTTALTSKTADKLNVQALETEILTSVSAIHREYYRSIQVLLDKWSDEYEAQVIKQRAANEATPWSYIKAPKNMALQQATNLNLSPADIAAAAHVAPGGLATTAPTTPRQPGIPANTMTAAALATARITEETRRAEAELFRMEARSKIAGDALTEMGTRGALSISNMTRVVGWVTRAIGGLATVTLMMGPQLDELSKRTDVFGKTAKFIQDWGMTISTTMMLAGPQIAGLIARVVQLPRLAMMAFEGFNLTALFGSLISGLSLKELGTKGQLVADMIAKDWKFRAVELVKELSSSLVAAITMNPFAAAGMAVAVAVIGAIIYHLRQAGKQTEAYVKLYDDLNEGMAKAMVISSATRKSTVDELGTAVKGTIYEFSAKISPEVEAAVGKMFAVPTSKIDTSSMSKYTEATIEAFVDAFSFSAKNASPTLDIGKTYEVYRKLLAIPDKVKSGIDADAAKIDAEAINVRRPWVAAMVRFWGEFNTEELRAEALANKGRGGEAMREFTMAARQREDDLRKVGEQYMRAGMNLGQTLSAAKGSIMKSLEATTSEYGMSTISQRLDEAVAVLTQDISSVDPAVYAHQSEVAVEEIVNSVGTGLNNLEPDMQAALAKSWIGMTDAIRVQAPLLADQLAMSMRDDLGMTLLPVASEATATMMSTVIGGIVTKIQNADLIGAIAEALANAEAPDKDPANALKSLLKRSEASAAAIAESGLKRAELKLPNAPTDTELLEKFREQGRIQIEIAKAQVTTSEFALESFKKGALADQELKGLQREKLGMPPLTGPGPDQLKVQLKRLQDDLALHRREAAILVDETDAVLTGKKRIEAKNKPTASTLDKDIKAAGKDASEAAKTLADGLTDINEAFDIAIKAGKYGEAYDMIALTIRMRSEQIDAEIEAAVKKRNEIQAKIDAGGVGDRLSGLRAQIEAIDKLVATKGEMKPMLVDTAAAEAKAKVLRALGDTAPEAANLTASAAAYERIASSFDSMGESSAAAAERMKGMNLELDAINATLEAKRMEAASTTKNPELLAALQLQIRALGAEADAVRLKMSLAQDTTKNWMILAGKKFISAQMSAGDLTQQFAERGSAAIGSFSDAIVDFSQGAKVNFGEMARSILSDLAKIALKMALMKMLGIAINAFSPKSTAPAAGGAGGNFYDAWRTEATRPSFDTGGFVGSGGSKVQVMAHEGEGIFTPRQMDNANRLFDAMASRGSDKPASIVVNNYSKAEVETKQSKGPDGGDYFEIVVKQVEERMQGRMDRGTGMAPYLERGFGLSRQPGRHL